MSYSESALAFLTDRIANWDCRNVLELWSMLDLINIVRIGTGKPLSHFVNLIDLPSDPTWNAFVEEHSGLPILAVDAKGRCLLIDEDRYYVVNAEDIPPDEAGPDFIIHDLDAA